MRACFVKHLRTTINSFKKLRYGTSSSAKASQSAAKDACADSGKGGPKLPKLPVPLMHRTLIHNYLMSVRPFLSGEEFLKTEESVINFSAPGGVGEFLHNELLERAKKEDNWLKEWWLNAAYLDFRAPVVVFSSPAQVFPRQKFECEEEFIKCASNIIRATLEFKVKIDKDALPEEKLGGDPLDMVQYKRILGTTRLPSTPRDKLVFHPKSKHIMIMCHNEFFKLIVEKEPGQILSSGDLYNRIESVLELSSRNCDPPVGILTSESRDNWTSGYALLTQDPDNKLLLQAVEEALFVVCLDMNCPSKDHTAMNTSAMMTMHGCGPNSNGGNRWYDKALQLVIGRDGSCGICYEHSPAEAGPVAALADYCVDKIKEPIEKAEPPADCTDKPRKMLFKVNQEIKCAVEKAQQNLLALVNDVDLCCFSFDDFGKDAIKELKLSPDSFIQIAIQFAFVRMYNEPGAQYESGSLRRFHEGRTDTIRTCTFEAIRAIQAMRDSCMPIASKANALRLAVNHHKDVATAVTKGYGVDRYLLALRMLAKERNMPEPEIFQDIGFKRSTHFRLSTSQVATKNDGFMVYGPVVPNGYGCCYNPRPKNINFGISSFNSCESTNANKFKEMLEFSMRDMKDILCQAPSSNM